MGIMVGRGTSPVTFDTDNFQKRLETIAREFGQKNETQKIDLKFFDVLDRPAAEEGAHPPDKPLEIIPKKEAAQVTGTIPLKISRKKQTFQKNGKTIKTGIETPVSLKEKDVKPVETKPEKINPESADLKKTDQPEKVPDKITSKGKYTVQIAAYKEFKDAVTQMAILEKKGFSSYREKTEKKGVMWYRVRSGFFATYEEAKGFNEKLNQAGIKSMIIKRDNNEDI